MAARGAAPVKHLGLIVEDESDVDVVGELIGKIASKRVAVRRIKAYGCGKMRAKCKAWAESLRAQGCTLLILVQDLDSANLRELEVELMAALTPCPISNFLIVIAVREIEAWLLADHDAITRGMGLKRRVSQQSNPEAIVNPKERLRNIVHERSSGLKFYVNTVHNKKIASYLTPSKLRRCASFVPFEDFIREHLC
jgi:hypothetical protein